MHFTGTITPADGSDKSNPSASLSLTYRVKKCLELLATFIPTILILESHGNYLRIKTEEDFDLALAFDLFERNKDALGIADYSISQATLEQIFIRFAREQEEEQGAARPAEAGGNPQQVVA